MFEPDAERDLTLSCTLAAPRQAIWRCWTEPRLLVRWFTPAPVETLRADIELRLGGRFHVTMRLPDGKEIDSSGCVLLVDPERRLVFTDTMQQDFRPSPEPFFTADIHLADDGAKTTYIARALHADAEARKRHEEMGFYDGWRKAAQQLEAVASGLTR
jgi:uncharacterized protein YndB with AHSA1/START domain